MLLRNKSLIDRLELRVRTIRTLQVPSFPRRTVVFCKYLALGIVKDNGARNRGNRMNARKQSETLVELSLQQSCCLCRFCYDSVQK